MIFWIEPIFELVPADVFETGNCIARRIYQPSSSLSDRYAESVTIK